MQGGAAQALGGPAGRSPARPKLCYLLSAACTQEWALHAHLTSSPPNNLMRRTPPFYRWGKLRYAVTFPKVKVAG